MSKELEKNKMTKPKVSVIVPIYNVEKYLEQCVNSILAQTLKDIEIILIDDGSPDNCGKICDEYAAKDKRVHVIHQPNSGYGRAVNHGIDMAQGEYIGIVESDDWIEADMYEKLYFKIKKKDADIIKCDFYVYNSFNNPASVPYPHGNANLQNIYAEGKLFDVDKAPLILAYHSSVWAALYKAEFIKKLKFKEYAGAAYVDFPFMFEAYLSTNKILLTYEKFNHYRVEPNQNSSTQKPGKGSFRILDQLESVKQFLLNKKVLDKYSEPFYYHASKCCAGFFYNTVPDIYKKDFYKKMRAFYKDFPTEFEYIYFEDGLKSFVKKILRNDKSAFDLKYKSPTMRFINLLSNVIPIRKYRRSFRKWMKNKLC